MDNIDLHQIAIQAMRSHGLLPAFASQALREAEAARATGPARSGDIRDLRQLSWFSIDNDDTRDLDQLSVAQAEPGGVTRLMVAVADVDAMVRPGGAVDEHAAANTTSVYTAAGVFPMLPETLSTDLTSLHEGRERLALVVDMRVQPDGTMAAAQLYRAAVLNRAKLTYDGVSAWLDGGAAPEQFAGVTGLDEQVRLHDTITERMRQWRQSRGALNVKTSAARPVFENGRLIDLRPDEKNRAKDLIADVMIATNSATARFLLDKGYPSLRRVLQVPRRWDRIVALAAEYGVSIPGTPDPVALDRFLQARRQADPDGFADLSLKVVKMLGSGQYATASPGATAAGPNTAHFGLALMDYAHSTAPNRRFPDLVTQRVIKAALAGDAPPYSAETLTGIARHCTLQEDNAAKVERAVLKAAAAWLMQPRMGHTFDAIVTGAAPKGTYVRIASPMIEGRVVRGFEGMDVGDNVRVRLVEVNAAQSHIDFERA